MKLFIASHVNAPPFIYTVQAPENINFLHECLKVNPVYQINNSFPCLPLTSQTDVHTISCMTEGTSQHHRTVNSISAMLKVL